MKNPALPFLKKRDVRALFRVQIIHQGAQPAFFVLDEGDWSAIKEYLNAPEEYDEESK